MKIAIGYIRISNKDQSNFSLDGQHKFITDYCTRNNISLLQVYRDNGQSAKNFDRAEWKELSAFISKNYKQVNMLLVPKYDRFSRNMLEALQTIELIEKKYSIEIESVTEPIPLKRDSPMYFQLRAQYLIGAQVEWMVIRERTKLGLYNAAVRGRYCNNAPIGYTNRRDSDNKPIIIVDPEKSKVIVQIFNSFLSGTPLHEIQKQINREGIIKLQGKGAVRRILVAPTYAGLVRVPEYQGEPAHLKKGIHEAIIPESVYYRVQALLHAPRANANMKLNDAFPLRGVLHCNCGRLFTAGSSKGRSKYVGYYFHAGTHRKNYNAELLHSKFENILRTFSLPESHIEILKQKVEKKLTEKIADKKELLHRKHSELATAEKNLHSVEEKFILNTIDSETYQRWRHRYIGEKIILQSEISQLNEPIERVHSRIIAAIPLMHDIYANYSRLKTAQKQHFVNLVFDSSLSYSGTSYRTNYLLPIFHDSAPVLAERDLLHIDSFIENRGVVALPALHSNRIDDTARLFQLIELLKVA